MEYLDREESFERQKREDQERWDRDVRTGAFLDSDSMMEGPDGLVEQARGRAVE